MVIKYNFLFYAYKKISMLNYEVSFSGFSIGFSHWVDPGRIWIQLSRKKMDLDPTW